ncbi:hypothetical protein pb186bvf_007857 [Paramecium bursaria]
MHIQYKIQQLDNKVFAQNFSQFNFYFNIQVKINIFNQISFFTDLISSQQMKCQNIQVEVMLIVKNIIL